LELENSNKTQVIALSIALIILASGSVYIANFAIPNAPEPETTLLNNISWVPLWVVRDPPGSDSYAKVFLRDSNDIKLKFETTMEGMNVTGTISTDMFQGSYRTSDSNNSDFVLVAKMNQTWAVSRDSEDNILVELVFSEFLTEPEMFSVDCAEDRGLWIQAPPSATESMAHSVGLGSEYHIEEYRFSKNQFTWKPFVSIRAGYYIDVLESHIPILVSLNIQDATLTTKCYFYDDSRFLNYTVFSSGYVEYHYPDLYICLGMFIWFEER
jgi:hypothetical protein